MDEEAFRRAVHRPSGLFADIAPHLTGLESMSAYRADPVAFRHFLDAVAALVHGDVAAVTEDQHIARLAVALVTNITHFIVLLHWRLFFCGCLRRHRFWRC